MSAASDSTEFQTPHGTFNLARYPSRPGETLVAWCAADSLLLEETHRLGLVGQEMLVVNDVFGALCVALESSALWTDSALTALALRYNEELNSRLETPVIWSTDAPVRPANRVVMRIPKQLAYFEYQLAQLAGVLPEGAQVMAAGMDKHLARTTAQILEKFIGPTQRHPGQRKARLFTSTRDNRPSQAFTGRAVFLCEPLGAELESLANVFSRDKLDIGTRFLLEQMHRIAPAETAIDLACGNGVLGLAAIQRGLAQHLVFCDESAMAVASARLNAQRMFPQDAQAFSFYHGDGLVNYSGVKADIILCNPPFHQSHTVDEFAGRHLLERCSRHLQPGGHLYLVANRHLNYLPLLRRQFQRADILASNTKFNILHAQKF